jgi:pimeloyl-ACP methyl ester carboxylesterase
MTVLLLHGLGATGRVWDGWQALDGQWLAPDLPGHGSVEPLPSYTFSSMAEAVAQALPVRRGLVVLGHSLGGVIALELASGRYDVDVDRVIALGVKVTWTADELAKASSMASRPVTWFDSKEEAAARFLRISGLDGLLDPADEAIDHGLHSEGGRWRLALDPAAFGVGAPAMTELLAASQADVVLARGELDPMNTDAELAALHDQVVTLPGLGHNAHVEDPAAVAQALSIR